MASTSAVPPLGKFLASTDKKTRDKAIKSLSVLLSDPTRNVLSKSEMDKLWKGIFYCFWMSDKPLVQQALATELAELLLTIDSNSSSLAFLSGFWQTTVREWNGIDRLRIDKYYMLIRRYVNASFRLLRRADWDLKLCHEYNDLLTVNGGPLCPDDTRIPLSLAYHLADLYLEELDKVLSLPTEDDESPDHAPLDVLLYPFFSLAAKTPSKDTYERVQSAVLGPLFQALTASHTDEPPTQKRRRLLERDYTSLIEHSWVSDLDTRADQLVDKAAIWQALLKKVFLIASEQDTRDSNRRKLYAFWKSYVEEDDDNDDKKPVDAS